MYFKLKMSFDKNYQYGPVDYNLTFKVNWNLSDDGVHRKGWYDS